jgi:hypothetical protein
MRREPTLRGNCPLPGAHRDTKGSNIETATQSQAEAKSFMHPPQAMSAAAQSQFQRRAVRTQS